MGTEIRRRAELEQPYRRPYRPGIRWLWQRARVWVALAAAGIAAVLVASAFKSGASREALLMLSAAAAGGGACVLGYQALLVASAVRRRTVRWDAPSELGSVRARRPHAAEIDHELLHPEYAVTVEDHGRFYLWRFVPLAVGERPPPNHVWVPGRPCYAAAVVGERTFDLDAGSAAEALIEAQADAARREAEERDAAARAVVDHTRRLELEAEAASTAAALQHLTGQRR
jgi:hypothetical protein